MKTASGCIECFNAQAVKAGRIASKNPQTRALIIAESAAALKKHSMSVPPPVMGKKIQDIVKKLSRVSDPYKKIKKETNRLALSFYPVLKKMVKESRDPLETAVIISIAGNIIDFGLDHAFDIKKEIKRIAGHRPAIFDFPDFERALEGARSVLILGDNSGETVFDRVLIEHIKEVKKGQIKAYYAVKSAPIINDALYSDAVFAGLNKCAIIVKSGSVYPGTLPRFCTPAFRKLYRRADMVISKGQGNYEFLNAADREIFFLLKAKCKVVARALGVKMGRLVLKNKR